MPDALERLRALEQAATPGDQYVCAVVEPEGWWRRIRSKARPHPIVSEYDRYAKADAEYDAALRNAAPALIEIAEAARELMDLIGGHSMAGTPERVEAREKLREALAKLEGAIAP
jgi:hypothetical protein